MLGETVTRAVLEDFTTAEGIREPFRAMLAFAQKVTLTPGELTPADGALLRAAGVSRAAAVDGLFICAVFNVLDRLADSLGFDIPTDDGFKTHPKMLLKLGYKM